MIEPASAVRLRSILTQLAAPRLLLDIGCGDGGDLPIYRAAFPEARIIGLDVDGVALRHARRKADQRTCLIEADAAALPLALTFAELILIRHPDVHRWPTRWTAVFTQLASALAGSATLLITAYTAPEIDFIRERVTLPHLPLDMARLAPVGLADRDRFVLRCVPTACLPAARTLPLPG